MTETQAPPDSRLEDLRTAQKWRRLRPNEQAELARLEREHTAAEIEAKRILDRQSLRDSISREISRNAEADRLQTEVYRLAVELEEQPGNSQLMIRRATAAQRLAAIATGLRKEGFVLPGANDRLERLASRESRERLEYCRDAQRKWRELLGVVDDERSTAGDEARSFVRRQVEAASQAAEAARQICINEE